MKHWQRIRERLMNWELWPFMLRYALILPVWFWYCLRAGSLWFFSSSNPTITFGGFEGEGKREMYDLLPPGSYPRTIYISPHEDIRTVLEQIREKGLHFPFVVKPDVGMKGLLFRKIDHEEAMVYYHERVPVDYIIQDLVIYPLEVSIFYYRFPGQERGVITGFLKKELMDVHGNGKSTLLQLIRDHPIARHREEEMHIRHGQNFDYIPAAGERYILTYAANLNRGARFTNLHSEIDDRLLDVFDPISRKAGFYYGRYDIKCSSVEDLKNGREFTILEFNGAGAEPNHVYQSGFSLFRAYGVILRHWKILYQISRVHHSRGIRYWSFRRGWNFLVSARRHLKLLEKYDAEIHV